jgi:hypothetical protein
MGMQEGEQNQPRYQLHEEWSNSIPEEQWKVYEQAISVTNDQKIPFLIGGAFALASYTAKWRNTKDLDFFVLPKDKDRTIKGLTDIGFVDYYPTLAYDRSWIYRATKDDTIVDIIWTLPNHRTEVDEMWFTNSVPVKIKGAPLRVLPPEELIWIKLYVLQKDRCDWPDVMNVLHSTYSKLKWKHLLARLEDDLPLLIGMLNVFTWLDPDRLKELPPELRERMAATSRKVDVMQHRVNLLDSRPWFCGVRPLSTKG